MLISTKAIINQPDKAQALELRLSCEDELESLLDRIDQAEMIRIEFAKPSDGRGFTHARLLRERFGFKGTLRAVGPVIADQVPLLMRCGFDQFELADSAQANTALRLLSTNQSTYQACADGPSLVPRHGSARLSPGSTQ